MEACLLRRHTVWVKWNSLSVEGIMLEVISYLLGQLERTSHRKTRIIPWSSPVPAFGDVSRSKVATVGLNPSNKEFVDDSNKELAGHARRFHTLQSLGLKTWSEAGSEHHRQIELSCQCYFSGNPYNRWFRELDFLISGTDFSYYSSIFSACHLDLIPFATTCKWAELTPEQRANLLRISGDALGRLVRDSPIQVLILNGSSVVAHVQSLCNDTFSSKPMQEWELPRAKEGAAGITGHAYRGTINSLAGVQLRRPIKVFGFNHNIQGSFGVTTGVKTSIRRWLSRRITEALHETCQ